MTNIKSLRIIVALLLALTMIAALFPVGMQAQAIPTVSAEVEAITSPETYISVQAGTQLADIMFPASLTATLAGGDTADVPVTWADNDGYNGETPGKYSFTAVLDTAYSYAGQVPVAIVAVNATAQEAETVTWEEQQVQAEDGEPVGDEDVQTEGSISGMVWFDKNSDGIFNADEPGISGYHVDLYREGLLLESTETQQDGSYSFTVENGTYTVAVTTQTLDDVKYLLPTKIMQTGADNVFDVDTIGEATMAVSEPITITQQEYDVVDINAGMRGALSVSRTSSTIVDGGTGIIVTTEADFRSALADTTYATIYLGEDIAMTSAFTTVALRSGGLVIDGYDPTDAAQTRHKFTSWTSSNHFQGTETNITFRNMEILNRNYYGVYRPNSTSAVFTVTLENVIGTAAQYFYGNSYKGSFIVRDSELTLQYAATTSSQQGELAELADTVTLEGTVVVNRVSGTYALFWNCNTIAIAENADVTFNIGTTANFPVFYYVLDLTVGTNAKLAVYTASTAALMYETLTNTVLEEGADAKFVYTGSGTVGTYYFKTTNLTVKTDAGFFVYAPSANAALQSSNITLKNPKQFIVLNPNNRAVYTNSTTLSATGIESIGYFYADKIASVYDSTNYEYIGTEVEYSKWWMQDQAFDVTASAWQGTSPTVTTSYDSAYVTGYPGTAPAPQTTLAQSNFGLNLSGQIAYGVVIKKAAAVYSDITITKTVAGDFGDLTKPFTFTITLMDSAGTTITTEPTLAVSGSAISGVNAPAYTSLTFNTEGQATFDLSHGQSLAIQAVDAGQVEISEAVDANYNVSITDGGSVNLQSNTTGSLTLSADMALVFTNTREVAVPTGISSGSGTLVLGAVVVIEAMVLLHLIFFLHRRKRKGGWYE